MSERVYAVSDTAEPHEFCFHRATSPGKAKTQHLAEMSEIVDLEYEWLRAKRIPWLDNVADLEGFETYKRVLEHGWSTQIGDNEHVTFDNMTDELWEQLKHECEQARDMYRMGGFSE